MRVLWPVVLWAAAMPAWAQTPPATQPDNAAIMRALDAINQRLDQLENKDRKPERRVAPAPRSAGGAAPPRAAQPPSQAVHGWFVHLLPWTEARDDVSIGGFPGPAHDFNFDMHSRYVPGQNRFIYNGRSLLHIKNDEEYTFAVELIPYAGPYPNDNFRMVAYNCSVELQIAGNRVLAGSTTFAPLIQRVNQDVYRSQLITGRTRLQPPGPGKSHPIEFKTDCWETSQPKLTYYDAWLPSWKKNRFRILFKTADDTAPRPFQPDELWYVGQP